MGYTNVTKQQIIQAFIDGIESLDLPDNEILEEADAENCIFTGYEEACGIVNPDPNHFPPVRN